MAEKTIKTRIIHKHALEADWNKAVNFIPKNGELIIYDADDLYNYKRIKIGDGTSNVKSLKFADENIRILLNSLIDNLMSIEESTNTRIQNIQSRINHNDIQIGSNQPSFACRWFRVLDESIVESKPKAILGETAVLGNAVLG